MSSLMRYVSQFILFVIGVQFAYSLLLKSIMGKVVISLIKTLYYFVRESALLLKSTYRMLIKFVFCDNATEPNVVDFKEYKKHKASGK